MSQDHSQFRCDLLGNDDSPIPHAQVYIHAYNLYLIRNFSVKYHFIYIRRVLQNTRDELLPNDCLSRKAHFQQFWVIRTQENTQDYDDCIATNVNVEFGSRGATMLLHAFLKALANEGTLLQAHCRRHKCFPLCLHGQHLLRTQILCPGHKKCF